MKTALELFDVLALLNRRHDRRISRRAADAFFFECFHERRFGVTRRRLGEMLLWIERVELERLALFNARQAAFSFVVVFGLLVAAFLVDLEEAVKLLHRTSRAEDETS